jgi:predicted nucleotidyltransferase
MTLLQIRDEARRLRRLDAWQETRNALKSALQELVPGERIIVFGSLTKPGKFNDSSDVDVALAGTPTGMSVGFLMGALEARLRRPVDLVLLSECRFREKIERHGEVWIC